MQETVAACIARLTAQLVHITETPRLEAEMLLAHALNMSRSSLLARLRETTDTGCVEALVLRRMNYEPLAYIFGEWEFFGRPFFVLPPLLTPRPETEHLIEAVAAHLDQTGLGAPHMADVCCGTGCIAVSIACHTPGARVYALDIRADAVRLAQRNGVRHGASVLCLQGDLLSALSPASSCLDVVVANPPYVPHAEWDTLSPTITRHEDPGALLAGVDGLDIIRRLVPQARARLRTGGLLALELGEDQFAAVARLMDHHNFVEIHCIHDLAGVRRIITGLLG